MTIDRIEYNLRFLLSLGVIGIKLSGCGIAGGFTTTESLAFLVHGPFGSTSGACRDGGGGTSLEREAGESGDEAEHFSRMR